MILTTMISFPIERYRYWR